MDTFPASKRMDSPLETARAVAVILLVSYHVIGTDQYSGLGLSDAHPLRLLSAFLVDLRMPLFAFIAGYVYALRPVSPSGFGAFAVGKIRRLAIPGAVALTAFLLVSNLMQTPFQMTEHAWRAYLFPYAHYWFLQAILLIFLIFGAFDVLTQGRLLLVSLALTSAVSLAGLYPLENAFSIAEAIYLAPYFIFGVVFSRHKHLFVNRRAMFVALALVGVSWATWVNFSVLQETGSFSVDQRDLQSLVFGFSACGLLLLLLPRVKLLAMLGPFAFTIYLYHVFGTSGMRRVLEQVHLDTPLLMYVFGLSAGLMLPVALHLIAKGNPLTRFLVLGLRTKKAEMQSISSSEKRA